MSDDEYREFLTFLFERCHRLPRARRHVHHHMMEEWHYQFDQAERACHLRRYTR